MCASKRVRAAVCVYRGIKRYCMYCHKQRIRTLCKARIVAEKVDKPIWMLEILGIGLVSCYREIHEKGSGDIVSAVCLQRDR